MTEKLWVFGTLIVCAVLFGLMASKSADAQGVSTGRWQITSGAGDIPNAWKIDTVTGETWYCVSDGGTIVNGQRFGGASGCFFRPNR